MLQTGRNRDKGFLLMEVMVSIAILSIGFVLILNSFTRSIKALKLSEDYFKAGLLLEEKIYEISNSNLEPGSTNGVFTSPDSRFSWNLDVLEIEEVNLNEVSLEISWNQGNKRHGMSLATYLLAV